MLNKFLKIICLSFVLMFAVTSANADVGKGQKVIIKKLKKDCGFNGSVLAHKHTQSQWKNINDSGTLSQELQILCPKSKPLKEKYIPHVYDFLYNFALDSGNVPSC